MSARPIARLAAAPDTLPSSLPPSLRRVLAARKVQQMDDLFFPWEELPRPQAMRGMEQAVALCQQAFLAQDRVLVVGDFDADGATSTALAVLGLRALGFQHVDYCVPNRFRHGYGLTPELVAEMDAASFPQLLITVDNGIANHAGIQAAQARGARVLVTDHHLPPAQLPAADAIVNPNQAGCAFPSKMLAGVGVCFYWLLALRHAWRAADWFSRFHIEPPKLAKWLDLVALGTIADLVPLDRLNRTLVQAGLERMRRHTTLPGIAALMQQSGKDPAWITSQDLAFAIAPRLNAAGRMQDMRLGIACLLASDAQQALQLAVQLEACNQDRKVVEQDMQQQAQQMLASWSAAPEASPALCLYEPTWHVGIVGLLASRLKTQYGRPTVVFAQEAEGLLKGSARSIPGVHMRDVLAYVDAQNPGLILRFGGHAMAAGLSLDASAYAAFQQAWYDAMRVFMEALGPTDVWVSDGALDASELCVEFAEQLQLQVPFGQGFEPPRFEGEFMVLGMQAIGSAKNHLRLQLQHPIAGELAAIAFGQTAPEWLQLGQSIGVYFALDVNRFRGAANCQLRVEGFWPSADAADPDQIRAMSG